MEFIKVFLLIGGLAYGISYLSDISGSLKVYKKLIKILEKDR